MDATTSNTIRHLCEVFSVGSAENAKKWKEPITIKYDKEVDALDIYFTKAIPGLIVETDSAEEGAVLDMVLFDLDKNGKIVCLECLGASSQFSCDFSKDVPVCEYKKDKDELQITFAPESQTWQQIYEGVKASKDENGKITKLVFENCTSKICNCNL
eukprot:Phypoly_transcript_23873.p1 GENE.Phypoly_transcript_23873~~Phypoly_transcript_23873.p1  ORF type:complete len:177 (+),score=34.84 Phypoly_transcript_23873:63-533(+)